MNRYFAGVGLVVLLLVFVVSHSVVGQRYKLAWSDEFDYKGLPDSVKWTYDVGDGCPVFCGWGDNERQYYTFKRARNARVESGYLVLEAHEEQFGESKYTSARLVTRGRSDWQYGKIEVRARLPEGADIRTAIWMLPYMEDRAMKWPDDGQIDIMNHNGTQANVIHGMVHSAAYNLPLGTESMGHIQLTAVDKRFHTFSIEWTPTKIEWFVDGKKYHKAVDDGTGNAGWPFNNAFYLILNLSVHSRDVGLQQSTSWPQRMEVDFVRVYQRRQKRRSPQEDEFMDEGY